MRVVGALWLALGGAFSRTQLFRPLVSRGCGYSAGLCCGGFAAGARLGGCLVFGLALGNRMPLRRLRRRALRWLCPSGFGWAHGALPRVGRLTHWVPPAVGCAAWISAGICTVLALRFALAAPRIGPAAGPADQALVCRACPARHESFRAAQAFCGFRDSWTGPGCLFCAAHYNIAPKLCQAALLARAKRRISRRRLPLREDVGVKAARQAASVFSHNA